MRLVQSKNEIDEYKAIELLAYEHFWKTLQQEAGVAGAER